MAGFWLGSAPKIAFESNSFEVGAELSQRSARFGSIPITITQPSAIVLTEHHGSYGRARALDSMGA